MLRISPDAVVASMQDIELGWLAKAGTWRSVPTSWEYVAGGFVGRPTVYRRECPLILKRAGLRHFVPFATRHTMACLLLPHGVNIKLVSRWLEHERSCYAGHGTAGGRSHPVDARIG